LSRTSPPAPTATGNGTARGTRKAVGLHCDPNPALWCLSEIGVRRPDAAAFFYPPGFAPLIHNASFVSERTRQLLQGHDVYFVDTLVGHRDPNRLIRSLGLWMKDLVNHGSHVLVIRKREKPRTRAVSMALYERRAMWKGGVRPLRDWVRDPPRADET
jgi:hypothetical protein